MAVYTSSTSRAFLKIPYTYNCAYCGAYIRASDAIMAEGVDSKGGYANSWEGPVMKLNASYRANANLLYEIEYAEKRLEHYRSIVASGKLKTFLETGKKDKADYFRVKQDSDLGKYLLHRSNNYSCRMTAYPYYWKPFDKDIAVKCPVCGKTQPWSEVVSNEGVRIKAIFMGIGVYLICMIPSFMPELSLPEEYRLLYLLPVAFGVASGVLFYKKMRKKQLHRLAALPWNADTLPRYDEDFIAQCRQKIGAQQKSGLFGGMG